MVFPNTDKMTEVADRYGESLALLIPRLYGELGTEQKVADELGISRATLVTWRIKLGIVSKWVAPSP